ncbi:TetR/AcrR family transcriptional regulator [Leptothoe sp. PORK10 BA2]|uniref:TetR/AcrR family transcriptional regulator n=1 Tax=Leptothoe sp. PORK10 BA2 TaxID=3110254 RepID=UPI002B1EA675|nr:TetR/AcrR family transcriptional regulator [Leptothoe sp. PORK10 BA2]MEA5464266.1 TetR/AcrR family transcriptional regulator [Leptothoe sp. PORK10 BA2]
MAASTIDTKEQIITVAERLFAERGFAGTTLRHVVSEAGVNLAAVNYHFGSKEELFRAVVVRFAHPVVKRELLLLAELKAGSELPSVETILTAILQPSLEILSQDSGTRLVRAKFMGRCRTEPEPIQSIVSNEFAAVTEAFLDVLQRVLPEQSRSQLSWKFDLVIAALIRVLTEAGQPHGLLKSNSAEDIQETTQQLVRFLSPGMRS